MLLLNYRTKIWTKITQDKKSRAGWTEKKSRALLTQTKRLCLDNFFVRTIFLSGQFFCPDNFFVSPIFFPDNIFFQTFFLSGQFLCLDNFFCPDNIFVRTKGHLPPSRISPTKDWSFLWYKQYIL